MITEAHKSWFETERGIIGETLEAFGVYSEGEWVVFPYDNGGNKSRRLSLEGKREFRFTRGLTPSLFHAVKPFELETDYCFLVEGETDTMRLYQETGVTVYGMNGVNGLKDDALLTLSKYDKVYVILDNDADYNTRKLVDGAWTKIRNTLGTRAKRVVLPEDVKDICEFYDSYTNDTFGNIMEKSKNGTYHYEALDLSIPPPAYNWLVKGLICQGDTTLIVGEPNVGKSWISLSLAVAVANEASTWLDYPLSNHGNVLYIDEENPHDVVYHRLQQLGMQNNDSIRYLHRQGIRLDRNFDKLLDEAITYQPKMIVIDSLTRFHTQDENNAGAMAGLFNNSINVLCRETGAAVIILHHTNKSDSNSSYVKTRGSSDIGAAIDCGIEARKTGPDTFNLIHFKSRRTQAGGLTKVQICDTISGGVELVTTSEAY